MSRILFIAVHPDDETLGCGGTMLKCAAEGHEIYWMILTTVFSGKQWPETFIQSRKEQIGQIRSFFNIKEVVQLGFETTRLDSVPLGEIISKIATELERIRPSIVFIPNKSDIHSDHRLSFTAIFSACKNFRAPFIEQLYMYECLSETEYAPPFESTTFIPNTWIDITNFINDKIAAMKIYKSEVMNAPFPRSPEIIQALAAFRGSRIGVKYAEAFTLLFNVKL